MKNFFNLKIFLILILMLTVKSYGWELDMSVDEEIKKKYNTSAIEDNLPNLPSIDKSGKGAAPQSSVKNQDKVPTGQLIYHEDNKKIGRIKTLEGQIGSNISSDFSSIKIKKGTKFNVKSNSAISDASRKGAQVSFITQTSVTQRYVTIPAGTRIYGIIEDSHLPQISGNGGLIEVKITSMVLNGNSEIANGKVLKANGKKIFFNNIKGERRYFKNIPVYANKGKPFYNSTRKTANKLNGNPFTGLIAPIVNLTGSIVYATTIIVSPVSAVFGKGGRISIPQGANFVLKLTDDLYLDDIKL